MSSPTHVLFLCTGNSARSIMAEAILAHKGLGRFVAHSAGSRPTGTPRPEALRQIAAAGMPAEGFRSKSWNEFSGPGAPPIDLIFTVCDNAANETCPLWPGHPVSAHWGIPDPAAAQGSEEAVAEAFRVGFLALEKRIDQLLALDLDALTPAELKSELDRIGQL